MERKEDSKKSVEERTKDTMGGGNGRDRELYSG